MAVEQYFIKEKMDSRVNSQNKLQIPTRIPEKIVVALFSGILVNSGILVDYTEVKLGTFSC